MPLVEDFKAGPAKFLETNVIVVPPETDAWYDTPGAYQFTLEDGGRNRVLLKPRIKITGDFIYAYYLPWAINRAPNMDLADKADFFFTSEMTNCRFSVLVDNPKTPKVAHVAGNTSKKDRNSWEVRDGFVDANTQGKARRLSISGSVGMKKTHEYGGGSVSSAFTFGQRGGDGDWKFFAQVCKGCQEAVTELTEDLKILGYVTI